MGLHIHSSEIMRDPPRGAHMPLDTTVHWDWRNPLNVLPALFLLVLVLAVVGSLLTLM
jgi:hypothetical protein